MIVSGSLRGSQNSPFPVFWCTGILCNDPEIVDELILDHRVYKREGVGNVLWGRVWGRYGRCYLNREAVMGYGVGVR